VTFLTAYAQVNEFSDEGKTALIYAIMGGSGDKERVQAIQLLVSVCKHEPQEDA
jgi:hypothetical protein